MNDTHLVERLVEDDVVLDVGVLPLKGYEMKEPMNLVSAPYYNQKG